jgi:hypothetical protein
MLHLFSFFLQIFHLCTVFLYKFIPFIASAVIFIILGVDRLNISIKIHTRKFRLSGLICYVVGDESAPLF